MTVTYLQLESALASAQAGVDASDLHGSVAGFQPMDKCFRVKGCADARNVFGGVEIKVDLSIG